MKNIKKRSFKASTLHFRSLFLCLLVVSTTFTQIDKKSGNRPKNITVVSLDPSATAIIHSLRKESSLIGIHNDYVYPSNLARKKSAGSVRIPNEAILRQLNPHYVFLSPHCQTSINPQHIHPTMSIQRNLQSFEDIFDYIKYIGTLFSVETEAMQTIDIIRYKLQGLTNSLSGLRRREKKRVIHCTGFSKDTLYIADFKTIPSEIIKAAGGLLLKKKGRNSTLAIPYSELQNLDPDVLLVKKSDRWIVDSLNRISATNSTGAKKSHQYISLSDDLLDFPSVRIAEAVSLVALNLYPEHFQSIFKSQKEGSVVQRRTIQSIAIPAISSIRIEKSQRFGFPMNSILVEGRSPLQITSTHHGPQSGVQFIGNTYLSNHHWIIDRNLTSDSIKASFCRIHAIPPEKTCLLFTGSSIDNYAISLETYNRMIVYALITAGVKANPIRTSITEGSEYKPGTINIIILTNMKLSRPAQTGALITATEAKTAILQELDIRAEPNRVRFQATGTGTDNILIVGGEGQPIDKCSGHTKIGELIAKAVRTALLEAIYKEDGIYKGRSVIHRLAERNITPFRIANSLPSSIPISKTNAEKKLDSLLSLPAPSEFIAQSLALDNALTNHLLPQSISYTDNCIKFAETIAGTNIDSLSTFFSSQFTENYLDMSINALLTGIIQNTTHRSESKNSLDPFFYRLEKHNLYISQWFERFLTAYPMADQNFRDRYFKEIAIENKRNKEYVNLNTAMTMVLNTDTFLYTDKAISFYQSTYAQNPKHFTIDDYMGEVIAHIINGEKGVDEYNILKSSFSHMFENLKPMVRQMVFGYTGGVLSIINPRLNIFRIHQSIDYGPVLKKTETFTGFIPEGLTQLDVLQLAATATFETAKDSKGLLTAINGVKSNKVQKYYWLSNINSIHYFNVPPAEYVLQHGDSLTWYYGMDSKDEKTK